MLSILDNENPTTKKSIVDIDFGTCPHCKVGLLYFYANNQLCIPDDNTGRFINQIIADDESILGFCPCCGRSYNMYRSVYGITTLDFAKKHKLYYDKSMKIKSNPIGYYNK